MAKNIRKMSQEKLVDRIRRLTNSAKQDIENYSEWLKKATEALLDADKRAKEQVRLWQLAIERLRAARFKFTLCDYSLRITVQTNRRRFRDIFYALGKLDPKSICKDIEDAEKGLVRVTFTPVNYPDVRVSYIHRLSPTDKCKIEKADVPARVDYQLVCKR